MIVIVAAYSSNMVLGKDNKLIWKQRDDMERFKAVTEGRNIILGRKTLESFGKDKDGHPRLLKNRKHYVLTRGVELLEFDGMKKNGAELILVRDIQELIDMSKTKDFVVIGGEQIYRQFLPHAKVMYLTEIHTELDGDAFFPEFSENEWRAYYNDWYPKSEDGSNEYDYSFKAYLRTNL